MPGKEMATANQNDRRVLTRSRRRPANGPAWALPAKSQVLPGLPVQKGPVLLAVVKGQCLAFYQTYGR